MVQTYKMTTKDPDLSQIREIVRETRAGAVVAFPTETVYGVGGPMSARNIQERLYEIKQRPKEKHFSYHIGDWEMIDFLEVVKTPAFRYLTRKYWPGPLTLLVNDEQGNKIGLRFPSDGLAKALINTAGEPFVATSANLSGEGSPYDAAAVEKSLGNAIEILIDGGKTEYAADSTIVDLTEPEPVILRKGAMVKEIEGALEKIKAGKFMRKRVLVVCTGNSCRSPIGEGWLKKEIKEHGLEDEIEISSCGIGTVDGRPATQEAIFVAKDRGIDIEKHRSRVCSKYDLIDSDVILAMSKDHYTFISSLVPQAKKKTQVLNIPDPIGQSIRVYEDVMNQIDEKFKQSWDWIVE